MKLFTRTLPVAAAALCLAHQVAIAQTATMTTRDPVTGEPSMTATSSGGTATVQAVPQPARPSGATVNAYGQSAGVAVLPPTRALSGTSSLGTSDPLALKKWEYQATRPATRQNADRNLVIRSTEADAKTMAAIEEDLNVMSRILEKAVRSAGETDKPAEAMGVPLSILPASGSARNLQIEGYGAIFQLRVNFPLKGAAEKAEAKPAKEPTNSDWEQSKRELYGLPTANTAYVKGSSQPEFDPKRVDTLKDSLLAALKNASNMGHVKPDETITVVVTSGGGIAGKSSTWATALRTAPDLAYLPSSSAYDDPVGNVVQTSKDQSGNTVVRVVPPASSTETTLTLRAKKSDIDSFAAGKLSLDQFRSKANWLLY